MSSFIIHAIDSPRSASPRGSFLDVSTPVGSPNVSPSPSFYDSGDELTENSTPEPELVFRSRLIAAFTAHPNALTNPHHKKEVSRYITGIRHPTVHKLNEALVDMPGDQLLHMVASWGNRSKIFMSTVAESASDDAADEDEVVVVEQDEA